jgi:hypothetical protein
MKQLVSKKQEVPEEEDDVTFGCSIVGINFITIVDGIRFSQ